MVGDGVIFRINRRTDFEDRLTRAHECVVAWIEQHRNRGRIVRLINEELTVDPSAFSQAIAALRAPVVARVLGETRDAEARHVLTLGHGARAHDIQAAKTLVLVEFEVVVEHRARGLGAVGHGQHHARGRHHAAHGRGGNAGHARCGLGRVHEEVRHGGISLGAVRIGGARTPIIRSGVVEHRCHGPARGPVRAGGHAVHFRHFLAERAVGVNLEAIHHRLAVGIDAVGHGQGRRRCIHGHAADGRGNGRRAWSIVCGVEEEAAHGPGAVNRAVIGADAPVIIRVVGQRDRHLPGRARGGLRNVRILGDAVSEAGVAVNFKFVVDGGVERIGAGCHREIGLEDLHRGRDAGLRDDRSIGSGRWRWRGDSDDSGRRSGQCSI